MAEKKHLSLPSLVRCFREIADGFPDSRSNGKDYSLTDIVMSGFACMFFQDPSLLQFQKRLETADGRSNLETLFGVKRVAEATQLRLILDSLPSASFSPVFKEFFHRLQRGKYIEQFQFYRGAYLVSIDATQYYHSHNISCEHCLTRTHKSGEVSYVHQTLQAALVNPEMKQVVPLEAEGISNQDGMKKQDCEINAAKRMIPRLRQQHPQLDIIILGDGLYSKQPMIELVRSHRMSFIFGAKPDDHKPMFEWIRDGELHELSVVGEESKTYRYQWFNDAPLNNRDDGLSVNYFELSIFKPGEDGTSKMTFHSSWVTNFSVSEHNVERLVKAARCRWKIENECFNNLKNQGYHLEHNFGHGEHHLAFNFYLLTLLAFFMHQVFELTDAAFQAVRQKYRTKRELWEGLRHTVRCFVFNSWQHLLDFLRFPDNYQLVPRAP